MRTRRRKRIVFLHTTEISGREEKVLTLKPEDLPIGSSTLTTRIWKGATMEAKKWYQNKKVIMGIVALVVAVIAMAFAYNTLKPKAVQGAKEVTLEVTSETGEKETYSLKTDVQFLKEVMDELKEQGFSYGGTDSEMGFMIDEVNGEKADFATDGAYWGIFVNGEFANFGIGEQPINDGDVFGLVYTIG